MVTPQTYTDTQKPTASTVAQSTDEKQIVHKIKSAILDHEYDISLRNTRINEIDRALYNEGLFEGLDFPNGHDRTLYNWVARVVDIHTSQLMGRPFQISSSYNKEDLSQYTGDEEALQQAKFKNKQRKIDSDARYNLIRAIIEDNGGFARFKHAGRIGSSSGFTVLKEWFDKDTKKTNISVIEAITNFRAGWSSNDFRDRDWDAYVWQLSPLKAREEYGEYLPDGKQFETTKVGEPWNVFDSSAQPNTEYINRDITGGSDQPRPAVTVIDFTGKLEGYAPKGGKLVEVEKGQEKKFSAIICGGCICEVIEDDSLMPDYYIVSNRETPRRPWGEPDVSQSALQINRSYIEAMSDWRTISNKLLFPLIKAHGFETGNIPHKQQRKIKVVPMSPEQNLEVLALPGDFGGEYKRYIEELKENFVRVTGVGRVLFDDPSVNANSNQALMTTLKGVIDIVEDKQDRWNEVLIKMFRRALEKASVHLPDVKTVVMTEDDWWLYVEWPSVMRHDDASYQQMLLNWWNAGVYSYDTVLQKLGVRDPSEEIDRMRDNLADATLAAVVGRQVGEIAHQAINKSLGIPPWGYVVPKVNLRGDLAPSEVGNIAHNFNWDEGPYGSSVGPQGNQGTAANDNFLNAGMIGGNGNAYDGAPGNYKGPQPSNPQLTPDQNTGQSASQPGSGAPAISPGGAINQANQQQGR